MTKHLILGIAGAMIVATTTAQPQAKQRLDSLFDILAAKNLAMGSIAISKNSQIFYRRSIGNARMAEEPGAEMQAAENRAKNQAAENQRAGNRAAEIQRSVNRPTQKTATANTEYRIGSITKLFTATLVFQLIEEKRLYLDDKLSAYFPDLPNAKQITIANLLDHRSGLHDFTKGTDFDNWKEGPRKQEELLKLITDKEPDFPPNTKADYNNSNYLVLTFIIEQITRTPYYALLNQRIIHRLGLRQTYYVQQPALTRYEAASYRYFDGKWNPDKAAWIDNFRGAGGIISTPTDLTVFISALHTGKLITKQSLQTMETLVDGYGMGIFPFDYAGHKGFGHNGKTEGFASSLTYYPNDHIAIAYCTNGEVWSKNWLLDAVRSILFDPDYAIPTFNPINLPITTLDQDTGRYRSKEGLEATARREGDRLILDAKGTSFPLAALTQKRFWNQRFGFFFDIDGKNLTIFDVESEYYLEKQ